jgi:hypothetical protein
MATTDKAARPQEARRPYHLGVALGLTAGVYAASLAGVSVLQIDHDRTLARDRQPLSDAIELLGRHHDDMASDLDHAATVFEDASTRYETMAADLQKLHADVVKLSKTLQAIDGMGAADGSGLGGVSVGGGVKLPSVSKAAPKSGGGSTAPTSNGTTGASGAP